MIDLRQINDHVQLLVEAIRDVGIYMIDPDGRVATWNPGAERATGYAAAEILGRPFGMLFTDEDRHAALPDLALDAARLTGRSEAEGWRLRKDGSRFWASAVINAVRDEAGRLIGFAEIVRDMTERQAALQALEARERQFRLLVQGVVDYAIFMLDPEGRVTSWNSGARRIKGYEPEEILGQHFSRFYTAEDRAVGIPQRALTLARSIGRFEAEGWRVRKDGTLFWASVVIDAIPDEDGKVIGFAKVTRDLTERRRAEQTLLDSERQFRLLVQGVTDYAIFMLDREGRVTNWNSGARRIKGYDAAEIVGQHFSRFYTEEDRAAGMPQRTLATAEATGRFEAEGWRVRKDGTRFWAHVVIDAIRDEAGGLLGFAKITRDITERREVQRTLEETRLQLVQSQKLEALGQLTGGVAHDFNNILQVISGGITLAEKLPAGSRRLTHLLREMRNAASRGAGLTRQLLAFSRRAPVRPEVVETARAVEEAVGLLSRTLGANITLDVRIEDGVAPVRIDTGQFEVALLNLAVNARDAMPDGGTLTVRAGTVRLAGEPHGLVGEFVRVSLRDSGLGIPAEVLGRVFEPFFTTKPVGKGTGLGLSQVHGFAQQAGGAVTIASEVNVGTEIAILLPAASGAEADERRPDGSRAEVLLPEGLRVLVVDDDAAVGRLTVGMLEGAHQRPTFTTDPEDVRRWLDEGRQFDLLISDVIMPYRMSGIELARDARRRRPDLPILLVTGYSGSDHPPSHEFPMLHKPFTALELAFAMKAVLQRVPATPLVGS